MTKPPIRNVAASVRRRLLNLAQARGEEFQLTLTRYAIERILYRLSRSTHRDRFVLKGATLVAVWTGTPHRATRDLDLLGFGNNSPWQLALVFREICALDVGDEGLTFDIGGVRAAPIREDNIYGGIRVEFDAYLGSARISLQVDIGFGDAITPEPEELSIPVLLDFPSPVLRAYQKETVVAEKFHAMVALSITNSRMKDFFDIAWLADHFAFDDARLGDAIRATFVRRMTALPPTLPLALSPEFHRNETKRIQWRAFVRRINQSTEPSLESVVEHIATFFLPFANDERQNRTWVAGGPWRNV